MKRQKTFYERNRVSIWISATLIMIILACSSMTVSSKSKGASSDQASYCHALEKKFEKTVRNVMDEQGYLNAGVTMNHSINEDGERTYVVKLHHSRLFESNKEQTQAVLNLLAEIPFEDGEVLYEII